MVILILGISGCGKGTQAKLLAQKIGGVPVISSGDAIRWANKSNVARGREAVENYNNLGKLVPDEIVFGILKAYMGNFDLSRGFIFDSFPRRLEQVPLLDQILSDTGETLSAVVHLETSPELALERMRGRDNEDGTKGEARGDANEQAIKERFSFYQNQTTPVLEVYMKRGILHNIDNSGTIGQVHEAVLKSLTGAGLCVDF
ncbi:adenylate kinase [candidate division WWE3 bacterium CG08_land_8_20_14_0_20_43_13]|uniref:Adenylate kinase n=1 Tax=candidate division WWE3 bacterium CG08_land_8_20_14_0_20_43_13 TaxID=1975087 RepID=A0A2H0X762_UNCKA|nr:MAG: adenylate kinase [candidate division WWE3 bacterium CG08_land_8_20_14_0_20_43_13]